MKRAHWPALACSVAGAFTLLGCGSTKTMYDWGSYQDSLYVMWIEPEDFDPAAHIGVLTEDIRRAEAENHAVPPGVRAHLAFLYDQTGNRQEAARLLAAEKAAFPESGALVDSLAKKLPK